jgi:hypothetical protein
MENKLEAVLLPVTNHEIDSGRFENFVNQFSDMAYTGIDLVICINNDNHKLHLFNFLNILSPVFQSVHIAYANIPIEEDIYTLDRTLYKTVPKYGLISGPNLLFLFSIRNCSHYNTVLLLETDCMLKKNWKDVCSNYLKYCGDFLISGAGYDGDAYLDVTSSDFNHTNGVAFYKTSSPDFYKLIQAVENYIILAAPVDPIIAYDIAITRTVYYKMKDSSTYKEWKTIFRKIVKNTLILNCSLVSDKHITLYECDQNFPSHVILHKKF